MNLDPVYSLLRTRTGLEVDSLGMPTVRSAVLEQMQALDLKDPVAYASRLAAESVSLTALIDRVVVPESWFFRGGDLFYYLAGHISEVMRSRKATSPFRVLSIPCSTGEEPYSLALALVDSGAADTPVTIDGVDISPGAVTQARKAIFTEFSFRQLPAELKQRFFRASLAGESQQGTWHLDPSIRERVQFHTGNLLEPGLLAAQPYDLILCRNLFIYLGTAARRQATQHLAGMLAEGGLLCLGHAESLDLADRRFVAAGRGDYFLYQRSAAPNKPPETHPVAVLTSASEPAARSLRRVSSSVLQETRVPESWAVPTMQAKAEPVVAAYSTGEGLSRAWLSADQGRYGEALAECVRLLEGVGPSAEVYALMGIIHQAQHHPDDARRSLERALYLDPNHPEALLHLMLIWEQRGDQAKVATLRRRLDRLRP